MAACVMCAKWWAWPATQAPHPWTAGGMPLALWPNWPCTWKNARLQTAIPWRPLDNSKPNGSINVVPGKCMFSMDMRAPLDPQRDALEKDVLNALDEICNRRGLVCHREATLRAPAAPSAPDWQARWEKALKDMGVPRFVMPSGAGHDAMKLHEVMPQAMLFVRGENSGISHNPLESSTTDDMQLCIDAFEHVLHQLA